MKRLALSGMLAVLLLALMVGSAFAEPRPPVADTFVDHQSANQGINYNGQELRISGSQAPDGTCSPTRTVLIRWNLSDVSQTIGSAELTLTTEDTGSTNAGGREVTLFKVADDTWDEATVTYLTAPAVGASIPPSQILPNPVTAGAKVIFSGAELVNYLNQEAGGDNLASFAVRFTTCAATSTQRFGDKETGVAAVLELQNPNAVTVSALEAGSSTTSPLLLAGIALLLVAMVAGAGLFLTRRNRMAS